MGLYVFRNKDDYDVEPCVMRADIARMLYVLDTDDLVVELYKVSDVVAYCLNGVKFENLSVERGKVFIRPFFELDNFVLIKPLGIIFYLQYVTRDESVGDVFRVNIFYNQRCYSFVSCKNTSIPHFADDKVYLYNQWIMIGNKWHSNRTLCLDLKDNSLSISGVSRLKGEPCDEAYFRKCVILGV